ncbi:hypothetical protein [Agitococcus lubricus]|uniref:Uncharacterized protein n=1 Tax=Agitococcus lubricus TaxID=1077255 RepID=A0A2T5IZP2_9GAMM|nr:hypothetical protein [Agitococcus lubricus]PTQ89528.1 hypothetical protein C8N29_10659 [Agitococcus lubricus]
MTTKPKFAMLPLLCAMASVSHAELEALSENALSEATGEGIAFVFDDIRFVTAPTSYIELVGGTPVGTTDLQRADVRYYGMSWTPGGTSGTNFDGSACSAGDVRCPLGTGTFSMAAHDNPFLLRVFDYNQIEFDGVSRNRTVLEFLGPTNQPTWRFAIWGEAEVGRPASGVNDCDGNGGVTDDRCYLQSQMIIMGKATTTKYGNKGAAMRFTTSSDPADPTYALVYDSHLTGDFRLSFNQKNNTDGMGVVPNFSDNEGMFLKGVQAHVPLGQLHYQSMTFKATSPTSPIQKYNAPLGNVTTEITQIPNNPSVYNDFYSAPTVGCTGANCGYQRTNRPARYNETHGFIVWGQSGNANDTGTVANRSIDQTDGLYYVGVSNFVPFASRPDTSNMDVATTPTLSYTLTPRQVVNLGDSQVDGLLVHHLYVKMLGAN